MSRTAQWRISAVYIRMCSWLRGIWFFWYVLPASLYKSHRRCALSRSNQLSFALGVLEPSDLHILRVKHLTSTCTVSAVMTFRVGGSTNSGVSVSHLGFAGAGVFQPSGTPVTSRTPAVPART